MFTLFLNLEKKTFKYDFNIDNINKTSTNKSNPEYLFCFLSRIKLS